MAKAEGKFLCTLPPTQGGGIGHQGEVPNGLHAIHRGSVLEGHRPPPPWAGRFYGMDKAGELLPQIGGSTRPQETKCSVVDRKVGLSLRDLTAASTVRMPLCLIICLACSGQNSLCAATTSLVEEIDISLD